MEGQLWRALYAVVMPLGKTHSFKGKKFSDTWVALTQLWAVLHDRPTSWACNQDNWPESERWHSIPSQSTMSRRLRTVGVLTLLTQAESALRERLPRSVSKWIDAKPLPVGGASTDRDARAGRGARGTDRGYKLHTVMDAAAGVPDAWTLAAMCDNEKAVARKTVPAAAAAPAPAPAPMLYAAADNEYDGNEMFELVANATAAASGCAAQLVVKPRRLARKAGAPGHRPQSPRRIRGTELSCAYDNPLNPLGRADVPPTFGQQLLTDRAGIERRFGLMGNFGGGLSPLPNWVRRPRRVACWVQCKLLVFLAREVLKQEVKNKKLAAA